LRIAFSARSPLGTEVDPAIGAAIEATTRRLEGLGHFVEPAEPEIDGLSLARDFLSLWFATLADQVALTRAQIGSSSVDQGFELDTLAMEALAHARRMPEYVESYRRWNEYGFKLGQFFERYDLYLTPTLALPPPKVGVVTTPPWAAAVTRTLLPLGLGRLISSMPGVVERIIFESLSRVPFTQLANVTGVPAMSVPLSRFEHGMPLGMQFVASHGGEGLLLRVASQLEDESWAAAPSL
jgi:amidase